MPFVESLRKEFWSVELVLVVGVVTSVVVVMVSLDYVMIVMIAWSMGQ